MYHQRLAFLLVPSKLLTQLAVLQPVRAQWGAAIRILLILEHVGW
jgi:hypothetical protein